MELQTNIAANGRAIVLSAMALNAAFYLLHGAADHHFVGILSGAASLALAYGADMCALLRRDEGKALGAGSVGAALGSWGLFILGGLA